MEKEFTFIGVFGYNGKKEKNEINFNIEPIVSKYLWNKVNKKSEKCSTLEND